jgi:hypothetical protein
MSAMQRYLSPIDAIVVFLVLAASAASAQEKGQIGLVMGYPGSIGLLWHPADRVAVRPTVSFSFASTDRSTTVPFPIELGLDQVSSHSTSRQLGFGLSGLFYLNRADSLSAYVSPRFSYTRSNASIEPSSPYLDSEMSSSSSSAGGFLGIQYALNKRLGVFGEVGVDYSRYKPASTALSTGRTISFRTTSDLGIVWYFGQ